MGAMKAEEILHERPTNLGCRFIGNNEYAVVLAFGEGCCQLGLKIP